MKIIALTTSHNRRNLTLRALKSLQEQHLPDGCDLKITLVDDGSTDGTGDAVRGTFPDVRVLQGTGELYWAGGMRFGWDQIVKFVDFDYLLVFNDDIQLYSNALFKLIDAAETCKSKGFDAFAIAGALKEPETNQLSYGGLIRGSSWHPLRFAKIPPKEYLQECDTLNMNFALISEKAIKKIGFLSSDFIHAKADYDFGLRLKKNGGQVFLARGYVGTCKSNSVENFLGKQNISFKEKWKRLTNIKRQPLKQRALYYRSHAGIFWPFFWLLPYARLISTSLIVSIKAKSFLFKGRKN